MKAERATEIINDILLIAQIQKSWSFQKKTIKYLIKDLSMSLMFVFGLIIVLVH